MNDIWAAAEDYACRWLEERGWAVRARNFRTRRSEVDIVARKGGILTFVEVKYASEGSTTRPLEKIDAEKRGRIVHGAMAYLSGSPPACEIRFDVAAVTGEPGSMRMSAYIEDAFRPDTM
ncbi:MAG: hypothetical protein GF388_12105 [Candidatus Aegiribacteria sp.]|nr:hypothetical protein [Candidatus Aegiribacteria sp.]MBD3295707.1 hypothetical protein [Candidatus Fermentibacteria bacterium]